MAEFADNLWENYIKTKYKCESKDVLSFYRAEVVSNDGNNKLTIQRPFDNSYQVSCTNLMANATVGQQVIVLKFGNGTANSNHLVVADGDGNVPSEVPDPTVSWEEITGVSATLLTDGGGYYVEGKHVYVTVQCTLNSAGSSGDNITLFSGFPTPDVVSVLATAIAYDLRGVAWINASGELHLRPNTSVSTSNTISVNGHYTLSSEEPEITIDSALSTVSTNPVQNRVVTQALNNKANVGDVPVGIPSGGTTGQMLRKASNTNYDMEWSNPS